MNQKNRPFGTPLHATGPCNSGTQEPPCPVPVAFKNLDASQLSLRGLVEAAVGFDLAAKHPGRFVAVLRKAAQFGDKLDFRGGFHPVQRSPKNAGPPKDGQHPGHKIGFTAIAAMPTMASGEVPNAAQCESAKLG
jgi:hypothetical protein